MSLAHDQNQQLFGRRDFFTIASLGALGFALNSAIKSCAKSCSSLTAEDRQRLADILSMNPTWTEVDRERPSQQLWMTRIDERCTVEISHQTSHKYGWYVVRVVAPESSIFYRCPTHTVVPDDKLVISSLFRQARDGAAPKVRPLTVTDSWVR